MAEQSEQQVNVVFQALGGQSRTLSVNAGTTLNQLLEDRDMSFDNLTLVHNSRHVSSPEEANEIVLQDYDVVYASRRRTHG